MSSISHIRAPIATDELEPDLAISPTSPHVRRPQGPRANQFARVRLAACRSASLFGVRSLQQFIAKAKAEPGTINFASCGIGTPQ